MKDSVPLKEVKVTVKEELKSLNNKVNEDLLVTTVVDENKEVQKTTVSKIVENEEKIEVPQNIDELVILTNKITKSEVPEASVKINVDEKLNVLNNIPPQNKDTKISLMDQLILKNSNIISSVNLELLDILYSFDKILNLLSCGFTTSLVKLSSFFDIPT